MRIVKRIIYTLLGLTLAGTVGIVGIILFAEYSGNHFTPDSIKKAVGEAYGTEDSRLVFDENGNLAEFPDNITESDGEYADVTSADEGTAAEDNASVDNSAPSEGNAFADGNSSANNGTSADDNIERHYVMDMGTNLFHIPDCADVPNISAENISEMTTSRAKILTAGYEPCTNCNP